MSCQKRLKRPLLGDTSCREKKIKASCREKKKSRTRVHVHIPDVFEIVHDLVPPNLVQQLQRYITQVPVDRRPRADKIQDFIDQRHSLDTHQPILMRVVFKAFGKPALRGGQTITLKNRETPEYKYSGVTPICWDMASVPCVAQLRDILSTKYGVSFNLCLINVMDPADQEPGANVLGAHRDATTHLVPGAPIACLVLSPAHARAVRLLWAPQGKEAKGIKKPGLLGGAKHIDIQIPHAAVYSMLGKCQALFKHQVLRGAHWRASFTFRCLKQSD